MNDIVVYHGSRGGLFGDIRPISRSRCDFGVGFYMGDSKAQAKGLIVETENPTLYTLRLRLSEIPEDRILLLNGKEWLNTVLACRQRIKDFSELGIAKEALQRLDRYDIVIGAIADDRMNEAMTRFSEYALTDRGLLACLESVRYGNQYVAKTESACSKIEIIDVRTLRRKELDDVRKYTKEKRLESRNVVIAMAQKYQREGLYLNEIVQKEKEKEGVTES